MTAAPLHPGSDDAEHLRYALRHVLAGLALPAQRWQILAHATDWGAPASLRQRLAALPEGTYRSYEAIVAAALAALRR
ncbi:MULTISPECIES: DUF2795 domain-containing protein [Pseudonocardia]|uniref:Uncharacterized protein n=2 Tax=Pseudonocardia TaxID=1847 RepID=A0A1Y2MY26_PSEAH|nr:MULTISPECIES: DUF2795 domain-containing protein [Pseudonocardia]OSY40100.1 hypothetical protein BG845_02923 [Pseudonocardia autotrophica]TDN72954.1 uncharacterized protein DUF2795 [Pseudonocardia autotrophica]BBG03674.1 hypothetical protein Pdca_48830 [Pseudonocardia autotrophica]GEC26372.1 hypothetical protein PSA01_34010 [Pseudonocardia saturnea]